MRERSPDTRDATCRATVLDLSLDFLEPAMDLSLDLVVVGGGTAGQTAALRAAATGARVALVDAVSPSPCGKAVWPAWLGTCAAVGCIPKKLLRQLAVGRVAAREASSLLLTGGEGTQTGPPPETVWALAVAEVHTHVRQIQAEAYDRLRGAGILLVPGTATLGDAPDTLLCTVLEDDNGGRGGHQVKTLTFQKLLVACGTRPAVGPYLTASTGGSPLPRTWRLQTSDDFFTDPASPGTTLIVGGSYVALELATILSGLGFQVTVMMRSKPLRGFDVCAAERLVADLSTRHQVRVLTGEVPAQWVDNLDGTVTVHGTKGDEAAYHTVVLAIGRAASPTAPLIAELLSRGASLKAGRLVTDDSWCLVGYAQEGATGSVYAVGDVAGAHPELQPAARISAQAWASRAFGDGCEEEGRPLASSHIPAAVYAGLEFATVGLSEVEGETVLGLRNVEVLESESFSLELPPSARRRCYAKLVCDASDGMRVRGCHLIMPHAADAVQGIALAMDKGVTLAEIRSLVTVHPTDLESLLLGLAPKRSDGRVSVADC